MFNKPNREFQAGLNADDIRRRRQSNSLSLRRKDRENKLQKKRQRILARSGQTQNPSNAPNQSPHITKIASHARKATIKDLKKLVQGCYSDNIPAQFECTKQFRMLLSSANNPPIQEVIDSGVIPRFIQFCHNKDLPQLQYESLWALLNVASGPAECTAYIIRNGGHMVFIELLNSPLYEIKEQALWALGNIAGDGTELKDLLLTNNILPNVYKICSSSFDKKYVTNFNNTQAVHSDAPSQFVSLLSTASWTLSNLCRGTAPPTIQYLELIVKSLQFLLKQALSMGDTLRCSSNMNISQKNEIIMNVAWGFSYLTAYDKYQTELVNKMGQLGIVKQFVALMDHDAGQVRHPINRLIGNVLTGSDEHTKQCLNLGILAKYSVILKGNVANAKEQREICWSLSNICAGPKEDKLLALKAGLFPVLINYLQNKAYETAKEALWAISNATTDHDTVIISRLVDMDVIAALCSFLRKNEERTSNGKQKILLVALECIENILIVGHEHLVSGDRNKFANKFEECGLIQFLEDMQADDESITDDVYDKCVDIMKKYFGGEAETFDGQSPNQRLNYGNFGQSNGNNNNGNGQFGFGVNNSNNNDTPFGF